MNIYQLFWQVTAMSKHTEYNVIVSDRAKRLMGKHALFLSQVNPNAAAELKTKLVEAAASLASMPKCCP